MSTRQEPSHDLLIRGAVAMDERILALLRGGLGKGGYLLDGLLLVSRERCPFE